jgi:2-C-methyl-D-erythritol 4-phosphate cytidylyltransferase
MEGNYAIIVAAGKGTRMHAGINKQLIDIYGKPLLYYSIEAFSRSSLIDGIILVCAKEEMEYCRNNIIGKYDFKKVIDIVEGGTRRQDSVLNGLRALKTFDCNVVLIHDGARPFVSDRIIEDGVKFARIYGSCACAAKVKDTIKIKSADGFSADTLDREKLVSVQTPQCFLYDLILECHEKVSSENFSVTDDTMVAEHYGKKVYLYDGSYDNIKITTPDDLKIAKIIVGSLS